MGRITKREKDILGQLVIDCSMYNFSEKDALGYINPRFGKNISGRTYRRYKSALLDGNLTHDWMNYFTKTGFVVQHQQLLNTARRLLEGSMRKLLLEEQKIHHNYNLILKLKEDIRQNIRILNEFVLGTPIIARIKERIEKLEQKIVEKELAGDIEK